MCQINQKIIKASKNIIKIGRLTNWCSYSWQGFTEGILHVVLFIYSWWSGTNEKTLIRWSKKKHGLVNILMTVWATFLYESHCNYNFTSLIRNALLSFRFPFVKSNHKNQFYSKLVVCRGSGNRGCGDDVIVKFFS